MVPGPWGSGNDPGETFQQLKVLLGDFKAKPKNKSNRNKERRTLILVLEMGIKLLPEKA